MQQISQERFTQHQGSQFEVLAAPDYPLQLEAVNSSTPPSPEFEAFSLNFSGPRPHLPQATYVLQHAELGELALFITPVAERGGRIEYESVFVRQRVA
ncbi:DUF6916 family protein [Halopseudomonas phragmitis]|uniref:DUF6916 domain-containing protein n=1 Tax=Halopseudomonas phragmitis TaxID=1931241 RepID=A0A1V0B176_9GAMM|nr:hypothetical protein [Halopseudomonas phragmitis]AQZ93697.1 hypothetical protein BVH74_02510 [Halopseudomonas phragmitis]